MKPSFPFISGHDHPFIPDLGSSIGHQFPKERFGAIMLDDGLAIIVAMAIEMDVHTVLHV